MLRLVLVVCSSINIGNANSDFTNSSHISCSGVLHPKAPGDQCCGAMTYRPESQICCGNSTIANLHFKCCGKSIFNSVIQQCCAETPAPRGPRSRPFQCCDTLSFNPQVFQCCSGKVHPIGPAGNKFKCCGDQIVNSKVQLCCEDVGVVPKTKANNCSSVACGPFKPGCNIYGRPQVHDTQFASIRND